MTANFYDSDDVTITASAVRGKGGSFELTSVTGIESGFRLWWIIIALVAGLALLVAGVFMPKDSAGDWAVYLLAVFCFGMIWTNSRYRPVFVRTATGLALLAGLQSSDARQKIATAFLAAKQAANRTGATA